MYGKKILQIPGALGSWAEAAIESFRRRKPIKQNKRKTRKIFVIASDLDILFLPKWTEWLEQLQILVRHVFGQTLWQRLEKSYSSGRKTVFMSVVITIEILQHIDKKIRETDEILKVCPISFIIFENFFPLP